MLARTSRYRVQPPLGRLGLEGPSEQTVPTQPRSLGVKGALETQIVRLVSSTALSAVGDSGLASGASNAVGWVTRPVREALAISGRAGGWP